MKKIDPKFKVCLMLILIVLYAVSTFLPYRIEFFLAPDLIRPIAALICAFTIVIVGHIPSNENEEEDSTKFHTEWATAIGIVLLLVSVFINVKAIMLDIPLIEANNLSEQYKEAILRLDKNVFDGDPYVQKCEFEIDVQRMSDTTAGSRTVYFRNAITASIYTTEQFKSEYNYESSRNRYAQDKNKQMESVYKNIRRSIGYNEKLESKYMDSITPVKLTHSMEIRIISNNTAYIYQVYASDPYAHFWGTKNIKEERM